jgi:hypothetical protein
VVEVAKKSMISDFFAYTGICPSCKRDFIGCMKVWNRSNSYCDVVNSSPAIMPLAALYFGVVFFKGAFLPQKLDPKGNIETRYL